MTDVTQHCAAGTLLRRVSGNRYITLLDDIAYEACPAVSHFMGMVLCHEGRNFPGGVRCAWSSSAQDTQGLPVQPDPANRHVTLYATTSISVSGQVLHFTVPVATLKGPPASLKLCVTHLRLVPIL